MRDRKLGHEHMLASAPRWLHIGFAGSTATAIGRPAGPIH